MEMVKLLSYQGAKHRRWAPSAERQLSEIIRTSGFGGYEMVGE